MKVNGVVRILILILFCKLSATAQNKMTIEIFAQRQEAMVTGGLYEANPNYLAYPPYVNYDSFSEKSTFGINAGFGLGDRTSLSIGVFYSQQGQNYYDLRQN